MSLLNELLNELKMLRKVFVVDVDNFKNITETFLSMHKNKQLPKKKEIKIDFSLPEDEPPQEEVDTQKLLEETFENLRIEE